MVATRLRQFKFDRRFALLVVATLFVAVETLDWAGLWMAPDHGALADQARTWPGAPAAVEAMLGDAARWKWAVRAVPFVTIVLAGFAALRWGQRLSERLGALREAVRRVGDGDLESVVRVDGPRELTGLSACLDTMREDLKSVLQLARKNAGLREDIALAQVAGSLLLPQQPGQDYRQASLWGHCCPQAQSSSWWWHRKADDGRVMVVLGYVPGTGAAPTMVSAGVAACLRDMLLHEEGTDPDQVLDEAMRVVSGTVGGSFEFGLCVLELNADGSQLRWASEGPQPPVFIDQQKGEAVAHRVAGDRRGQMRVDPRERLLVLFGASEEASLTDPDLLEAVQDGELDAVGRKVLTSLLAGPQSTVRAFVLLERADPAARAAA